MAGEGFFDPELIASEWFDDGQQLKGWFDESLVAAASGATYTLVAATGSFALVGSVAALKAGRKLVAATSSFAQTGNAAAMKAGRNLAAGAGALALTGNSAVLNAGRELAAATGSFALTGSASALKVARKLPAATGAFTLTGSAAALTYTPAVVTGYTMAAGRGVFALTARPAVFVKWLMPVPPAGRSAGGAIERGAAVAPIHRVAPLRPVQRTVSGRR